MDLSHLTNDELRDHIHAGILEAEKRRPHCRMLKLFHKVGHMAECQAVDDGDVSLRSGGSDKGDGN